MQQKQFERLFLNALKQLTQAGLPKTSWSFGGGTVLMLLYSHRYSKDIDIFFNDRQYLAYVSPRVNDVLEDSLGYYVEQSNFCKLYFQEGEVDFIYSPQITQHSPLIMSILGEKVYTEDPVEIIAKKIFYRAEQFKTRDIFDLATVYLNEPSKLLSSLSGLGEKLNTVSERIRYLVSSETFTHELAEIQVTSQGIKIKDQTIDICEAFLEATHSPLEEDDDSPSP